jgi:kynurenine formamidase
MARRFVDISVTIEDKPFNPPHHRPKIVYRDHEDTWDAVHGIFPGLPKDVFPEGKAWATEQITLSTHGGTHMDSPWHYHPTMNHALKEGGEKAVGIDEVPLDWCMRPGVKLDFRKFPAGYVATADDVEAELKRIGHRLEPLDIVLVNTRAGALYGKDEDYWEQHCGMGRAATLYLLERGVRVVGTDAWGWDAPFKHQREHYEKTGDRASIWEGHKAGRDIGYFQMEKLHNLEALPGDGFTVVCFPVKIKGASAGWTRAVAILED